MDMDTNPVVSELTHGAGLVRELEAQLNQTSIELCKSLAHQILETFDKAIYMVKSTNVSPRFVDRTASSERKEMPPSKKRKTQAKYANHVKLGTGPEAEGPLDDGYSWRKYGQKEILGAKHPRGYYRCTHRNSQGCPAMKQVQRSDVNPSIFEVTYRGIHTCHSIKSTPNYVNQDQDQDQNQHLLLSFQANLKVETENLDSKFSELIQYPSFSFKPENSPSSTLDTSFKTSYNPAFLSPATSESNYFSTSPRSRMNGYGLQASESDFTEIVSASTSACNSPMLDLDFLPELDQEFPFDSFFS